MLIQVAWASWLGSARPPTRSALRYTVGNSANQTAGLLEQAAKTYILTLRRVTHPAGHNTDQVEHPMTAMGRAAQAREDSGLP